MNLMADQTKIPYKIAIGTGYFTNEGNCFAKKKKKNVNEIAIIK